MFALKVLKKDNIIKRNQVEHTKTERSVLGYVKHPFIVGLNMAFQSPDKLYFVLDYWLVSFNYYHSYNVHHHLICSITYIHSLILSQCRWRAFLSLGKGWEVSRTEGVFLRS